MRPNTIESILARGTREATTGCLVWHGSRHAKGYGLAGLKGKQVRVHRLAWEAMRGPIPAGLKVCHTCDNPPCFEPGHLFLGTQKQNLDDMRLKGREHTVAGQRRTPTQRQRMATAATARWAALSPNERQELGRRGGEARRGRPRGPYKGRAEYTPGYAPSGSS